MRRMSRVFRRFGLGFFVLSGITLKAVEVGDAPADVLAELGAPTGRIAAGDRTIWYYDAGEVSFRNDRVNTFQLRSEAALKAEEERAERAAVRRLAEGRALLARKTASVDFKLASPDEQLRFYRWFAARFPEISVEDAVDATIARKEKAEAELRQAEVARPVVLVQTPVERRDRRVSRWPAPWRGFCPAPEDNQVGGASPGPPKHSTDAAFGRHMNAFEESERRIWSLMSGF
jgi:hypothetical protein